MPIARISRSTSAITLIELLAAMAVVAILVGIGFGSLRGAKERAAITRARGELATLTQALESYKNVYGDYPQTGSAGQATPAVGATIGRSQAQSLLFNALTGVYGPTNFSTRINGPILVEAAKLRVEVPLVATTFALAEGAPPMKRETPNAFLDPWGNRYMYYYKAAPMPGTASINQWRLPGYILYSVGPDGAHTPPNISTGLFTGTTQTTGNNADNVFATP